MLNGRQRDALRPQYGLCIDSQCKCNAVAAASNVMKAVKETVMPRILVVDEDPMVSMALDVCLARYDHLVTIVYGGESGLRSLEDACFDLMIVDV